MTRDQKFDITSPSSEIKIHSKVDVEKGMNPKMFKVKTDEGLGHQIRYMLGYGSTPWSKNPIVLDEEHGTKKSTLRGYSPKNVFGNFSMISSLGTSFIIGIAHSSHLFWDVYNDLDSKLHLGSVTLVEVPANCVLLFHGLLFHYGAKSKWGEHKFDFSLRTFSYLTASSYEMETEAKTWKAQQNFSCENCDKCKQVNQLLIKHRNIHPKENIWKYEQSDYEIHSMDDGEIVMGDVNSLGWVVLKHRTPNDMNEFYDTVACIKEEVNVERKNKLQKGSLKWTNIQKPMQFKSLSNIPPNEEYFFKRFPGVRVMKKKSITEGGLPTIINDFIDQNAQLCSNHLEKRSIIDCTYVAKGKNILANIDGVKEQNIHTDYNPIVSD